MEGTDSDYFAIPDEDKKISEMVIELAQRPGENPSTGGIKFDQSLNLFDVIQFGFSNHLILLVSLPTGPGPALLIDRGRGRHACRHPCPSVLVFHGHATRSRSRSFGIFNHLLGMCSSLLRHLHSTQHPRNLVHDRFLIQSIHQGDRTS